MFRDIKYFVSSFSDVLTGKVFEIDFNKMCQENEKDVVSEENIQEFSKLALEVDSDDDENDLTTTPFSKLAEKMENVTSDGKIKKRIRRQGKGDVPPAKALVSVLYCSYLEFHDEPTDVSYLKKPLQFRLGTYGIAGLNIAVASMKLSEKSHFLIYPEYAFGAIGHPPRIPANATFFFQIELLKFTDSGPALEYDNLTAEDRKSFTRVQRITLALMETAKEHLKHNVKLAIRDYNRALGLLETCHLANIEEQEQQQKLLLRIYTNLAICYNKENQPKKACCMCNEIYNMVRNTSLEIPAKVFFNNGRALYMIGEYNRAKQRLIQAQRIEPRNREISEELLKVNQKWEEENRREKKFAQLYVSGNKQEGNQSNVDDNNYHEFRKLIKETIDEFKNNDSIQYTLPSGLTTNEHGIAKSEVEKAGLKLHEFKQNNSGKLTYYITKM